MSIPGESFFIAGTFLAGIFYLPHCSVMCGPLVLLFKNRGVSYQVGRLLGYTAVGALLGIVGQSLEQAGLLLSIQNGSLYGAALFMILYGIYLALPARWKFRTPSWVYRPAGWIASLRQHSRIPASLSVFLAGTLSALLPCGVLYPVWALAAGAGSPLSGAGIGLSFVLGTIPGLLVIQFLASRAEHRIAFFQTRKIKYAATAILLSTGVLMMLWRGNFAPRMDFSESATENPEECHTELPFGSGGEGEESSVPPPGLKR